MVEVGHRSLVLGNRINETDLPHKYSLPRALEVDTAVARNVLAATPAGPGDAGPIRNN
jgi:hypothetical protein